MDRDGLADFLRRRRAALRAEDVGLPPGRRRRAPGLRPKDPAGPRGARPRAPALPREEVAARAHISTDFYTRLEQRRGARPSESTVAALALALRLNEIERDHLFALAGHNAPPTAMRRDEPSPGLLRVLEQIDGSPAMIVSDLGVTLRQNELAKALLGDHSGFTGLSRSMIYRWFTEPERRAQHPLDDQPRRAREHVA